MSTTLTMIRLYLKMQHMPRIPHIGHAGILYSYSLVDRERSALRGSSLEASERPEFIGAHKLLVKKGSWGSYTFRRYSTSTTVDDIKKAEKERLAKKKKVWSAETIKIMLVNDTGTLSTMTLVDANSLAKKKRMDLIHITDPQEKPVRTDKEIYKLVSKLEGLQEEENDEDSSSTKEKKEKDIKTVMLKGNTGQHDINAKLSMMLKWIQKDHRVRVSIAQSREAGDAENVFKTIERKILEAEGQIQQKIMKGNEIRFYVAPPKKKPTLAKTITKSTNTDPADKSGDEDPESEHDDENQHGKRNGRKSRQRT